MIGAELTGRAVQVTQSDLGRAVACKVRPRVVASGQSDRRRLGSPFTVVVEALSQQRG